MQGGGVAEGLTLVASAADHHPARVQLRLLALEPLEVVRAGGSTMTPGAAGGARRGAATLKFIVYTMAGSLLMLVAAHPQKLPGPLAAQQVLGSGKPGFSDALQRWSVPQHKDWFAYKLSEPQSQRTVAASLSAQRGVP